ncbi:hypothetical protein PMIN01_06565 [Paraphaeosphaeria minitans]|uniref:Uncharacterized protein n=1 Tax=Paraphaeosphaeria minitans TaxID=565426 RepID=A0A9P6KQJ2_9PLEO|nr:hypothetical protein PMIN01_06565 [Paraphaeosphaeria minitans]
MICQIKVSPVRPLGNRGGRSTLDTLHCRIPNISLDKEAVAERCLFLPSKYLPKHGEASEVGSKRTSLRSAD